MFSPVPKARVAAKAAATPAAAPLRRRNEEGRLLSGDGARRAPRARRPDPLNTACSDV